MIRWHKRTAPNPERFLEDLKAAQFGSRYDAFDRYRDFKTVFGTAAGRRVLAQIMEWCFMWRSTAAPEPHDTYYNEGKRAIGLQIMKVMGAEPPAPMETQRTEDE